MVLMVEIVEEAKLWLIADVLEVQVSRETCPYRGVLGVETLRSMD